MGEVTRGPRAETWRTPDLQGPSQLSRASPWAVPSFLLTHLSSSIPLLEQNKVTYDPVRLFCLPPIHAPFSLRCLPQGRAGDSQAVSAIEPLLTSDLIKKTHVLSYIYRQ